MTGSRAGATATGAAVPGPRPRGTTADVDASTSGAAAPVVVVGPDAFRSEVLESELPVVVDFGAPWCAPCRAIAPVLVELARELTGRVKVVTVDTDDNQDLARAYGIVSIPTLHFFAPGGELTGSLVGAHPKRTLRTHLTALARPAP